MPSAEGIVAELIDALGAGAGPTPRRLGGMAETDVDARPRAASPCDGCAGCAARLRCGGWSPRPASVQTTSWPRSSCGRGRRSRSRSPPCPARCSTRSTRSWSRPSASSRSASPGSSSSACRPARTRGERRLGPAGHRAGRAACRARRGGRRARPHGRPLPRRVHRSRPLRRPRPQRRGAQRPHARALPAHRAGPGRRRAPTWWRPAG